VPSSDAAAQCAEQRCRAAKKNCQAGGGPAQTMPPAVIGGAQQAAVHTLLSTTMPNGATGSHPARPEQGKLGPHLLSRAASPAAPPPQKETHLLDAVRGVRGRGILAVRVAPHVCAQLLKDGVQLRLRVHRRPRVVLRQQWRRVWVRSASALGFEKS